MRFLDECLSKFTTMSFMKKNVSNKALCFLEPDSQSQISI